MFGFAFKFMLKRVSSAIYICLLLIHHFQTLAIQFEYKKMSYDVRKCRDFSGSQNSGHLSSPWWTFPMYCIVYLCAT